MILFIATVLYAMPELIESLSIEGERLSTETDVFITMKMCNLLGR
jgi:hypothetical protein